MRNVRLAIVFVVSLLVSLVIFNSWLVIPFAYYGMHVLINRYAHLLNRFVDGAPRTKRVVRSAMPVVIR